MRIPGLWAPSPEVISQLWEQSDPHLDPFTALGGGIEAWELHYRLGGSSELTAKAGAEMLEDQLPPGFQTTPPPTEGDHVLYFERLPRDQRLSAAADSTIERFKDAFKRLSAIETERQGEGPDAQVNTQGLPAYVLEAGNLCSTLQRAFRAVPAEQSLVLLQSLKPWIGGPLVSWAWSLGLARIVWGPNADPARAGQDIASPPRVWPFMVAFAGGDLTSLCEANLVLRLMQGAPTMASHVCGRWLVQQIWADDGIQGPVPNLTTPLLQELPRAYDVLQAMLQASPDSPDGTLREFHHEHLASLTDPGADAPPSTPVAAHGIALGAEKILSTYTMLLRHGQAKGQSPKASAGVSAEAFAKEFLGHDPEPWDIPEPAPEPEPEPEPETTLHEILQKERVATDADAAEDPECLTTYRDQHLCWQGYAQRTFQRLDAHADPSGSLGFSPYRTLLTTVDQELATLAATTVLKWRHWFHQHRLKTEPPKGFLADLDSFYANTISKWDHFTPNFLHRRQTGDVSFWLKEQNYLAIIPQDRARDWRLNEILRPLVYACLSSMCAGLRIPGAERLYAHSTWVGTEVWRPTWPGIQISKAVGMLFSIAAAERRSCTDTRVMSLWQGHMAEPEELEAWLQAQPFNLAMLEKFRRLVVARETEIELIGSLAETLYSRPHYKPTWLVAPLALLTEPRRLQADPLPEG